MTGSGGTLEKLDSLRSGLRGELVLPSDAPYDSMRRVWNGAIDRRPAVIVRCRDEADVVACVKFSRERGVRIAVRGGGHGVAGSAVLDDGLVIDLSLMRAVHVEPETSRVWVQGGAVWGDVDHATQLYGLAIPGGFVSTTGVGGFTLGGGIAWTSRKLGLACDSLVGAEVVTAEGRVIRTSATERSDLLWALRGGGGNFGVVTSFSFRAQPMGPMVYGGFRIFPGDRAREVLHLVADMYRSTPEEFNVLAVLTTAPPAPFVPSDLHGRPIVVVAMCFIGGVTGGPAAAGELLALSGAAVDHVGPIPYVALQSAFDPMNPPGLLNYWKSAYADHLAEGAIDAVVDRFAKVPSLLTELHFQYFGGAVSRISAHESAVGHRSSPFLFNLVGKWTDPRESERNTSYIRELWEALRPFSTGGVYRNFLTDQTTDLTRAAYGGQIYAKLAQVKRQYDPENIFRGSHNVLPAP